MPISKKDPTKAFDDWLFDIGSKRRFQYYEGFIGRDRFNRRIVKGEIVYSPNKVVDDLADDVWNAYMAGMVHLTQARVGTNRFQYWATKCKGVL